MSGLQRVDTKEADLADWKHVEQFLSQELIVPVVTSDVGYQLGYIVGSRPKSHKDRLNDQNQHTENGGIPSFPKLLQVL